MWKQLLIGRPLTLKQRATQTVTKKEALALLSSDALSSVAYGPEQILIVLLAASAMHAAYTIPITVLIVLLLVLLVVAYRQVIVLFPEGGGAYKVARTFIGEKMALVSASLLLVDYILTIAVSVSAGVDALLAAVPTLTPYRLLCVIAFILLVLLLNLRGVAETSKLLLVPVYGFIVLLIGIIVMSFVHWHTPVLTEQTVQSFSLLLIIKAFAVGCSALTGVEAISNAVPSFKKPAAQNARATLLSLSILLAALFSAIMLLATHFQLMPMPNTTVLSSLAEHAVGRDTYYFVFQAATICILLLAANTSFTAFPQLLANLARDGYAPRIFLNRGDRLGYSNSMIFLAVAAIVASIVFQGNTEMLIPLYAVGVFVPFTIALYGLVRHATRVIDKVIPAMAACLTATVVVTLVLTKTLYILPLVVFIPLMLYVLRRIHCHYDRVQQLLTTPYVSDTTNGALYVLPMNGLYATTEKAIALLQLEHKNCVALYVATSEEECAALQAKWSSSIRLLSYKTSHQNMLKPLLRGIHKLAVVAEKQHLQLYVVVPQLVVEKRWEALLHNHHAFALKQALLHEKNVVVITVPFQLSNE